MIKYSWLLKIADSRQKSPPTLCFGWVPCWAGRRGGLMVSALDSGSNGLGSSPGWGTVLCSWARHFTPIVPLSSQFTAGVTLRWTSIPSRGGVEILLVASCYRNRDKLWPDGPLGSYTDLPYSAVLFLCFFSKRWQNQPPNSTVKPPSSKLSDNPEYSG